MSRDEISDLQNVLVMGMDNVALALSAQRAGYNVFAVDHFGDQDLQLGCREWVSVIRQRPGESSGRLSRDFHPELLLQLAKDLLKEHEIQAVLLSSGLDDSPEILFELNELVPILGNPPRIMERVRDEKVFFRELSHLGIAHPETAIVEDLQGAEESSKDIGFPVIIKPGSRLGGAGIRRADDSQELGTAFREASLLDEKVLIQEYISGTPASASLISSPKGATTLTLNEQLIGRRELGPRDPFGYCGNVVPLLAPEEVVEKCKGIVERVAQHFNLLGSNGVDLVISEKGVPHVIEVNPRFQATLDCVESLLRINLVEAHVEACVEDQLPTISKELSLFCGRFIFYTPQRLVAPNLSFFRGIRDIPLPGVIVERGEPLCSLILEATNRDRLLQEASEIAETIRSSCDVVADG